MKKEFKTFQVYLSSFGDLKLDENLKKFKKDLRKRFKYLGGITVNHFLTDIGLNVSKPDRVLCRIFYRLGLIKSVESFEEVIEVCRKFADSTKYPIRYIDIIFVIYGQVGYKHELDIDNGICLEKNPKCDLCRMTKYCNYYKTNK